MTLELESIIYTQYYPQVIAISIITLYKAVRTELNKTDKHVAFHNRKYQLRMLLASISEIGQDKPNAFCLSWSGWVK